jgi:hypothetical protein
MNFLRGFGQFWYDFIVGDDWKLAAVVALVVAVGAALVAAGYAGALLVVLLGVGLAVAFTLAMIVDVQLAKRKT